MKQFLKLFFVGSILLVSSCMANSCRVSLNASARNCNPLLEQNRASIPSPCDCANFNEDGTFNSCCGLGDSCVSGSVGIAGCTAKMVGEMGTTTRRNAVDFDLTNLGNALAFLGILLYIVVPIVSLAALILLVYCCCIKKIHSPIKQDEETPDETPLRTP